MGLYELCACTNASLVYVNVNGVYNARTRVCQCYTARYAGDAHRINESKN